MTDIDPRSSAIAQEDVKEVHHEDEDQSGPFGGGQAVQCAQQ